MFYNNQSFDDCVKGYIDVAKTIIHEIDKSNFIYKNDAIQDIMISLIIKSTGQMELYFGDIMREFAIKHSSPIFYNFFEAKFMNGGKNANPENINGLLNIIKVEKIEKNNHMKEYTSLDTLYKLRNDIAHGNTNLINTPTDIITHIETSLKFFKIVIKNLDKK